MIPHVDTLRPLVRTQEEYLEHELQNFYIALYNDATTAAQMGIPYVNYSAEELRELFQSVGGLDRIIKELNGLGYITSFRDQEFLISGWIL